MANHTKGRPHLIGNKSRTGLSKPPTSGTQKSIAFGAVTNFTFRIGSEDLASLEREAKRLGESKGWVLRDALKDYLEDSSKYNNQNPVMRYFVL